MPVQRRLPSLCQPFPAEMQAVAHRSHPCSVQRHLSFQRDRQCGTGLIFWKDSYHLLQRNSWNSKCLLPPSSFNFHLGHVSELPKLSWWKIVCISLGRPPLLPQRVSSACGSPAPLNTPVLWGNRKCPGVCPVQLLQKPTRYFQRNNATLVMCFGGRRYPERVFQFSPYGKFSFKDTSSLNTSVSGTALENKVKLN